MTEELRTAIGRAADLSRHGSSEAPEVQIHPGSCGPENLRGLREPLDLVLCGRYADLGLEEMRRSGALRLMSSVKELVGFGGGAQGHKDLWDHTKRVVAQSDPRPVIRWAALYHDVGKVHAYAKLHGKVTFHGHESMSAAAFKFFREASGLFGYDEGKRIEDVVRHLGHVEAFNGTWTDSAVRRLDHELGPVLDDAIALSRADITTGRDDKRRAILRSIDDLVVRLERTRAEDDAPRLPKGLGDAIHGRLGVPKDRRLGDLMGRLKLELENGRLPPDADVDSWVMLASHVLEAKSSG